MDSLSLLIKQIQSIFIISMLLYSMPGLWPVSSWAFESVKKNLADKSGHVGSGVLDGMMFIGEHGSKGKPADVKDTFVFKNGNFFSEEGEAMCDAPACPYFTRQVGNAIEFISETRCRDKDATIVWRGTMRGKMIKGVFQWTSKRWYWTIEKEFWFEGTLDDNNPPTLIGSH